MDIATLANYRSLYGYWLSLYEFCSISAWQLFTHYAPIYGLWYTATDGSRLNS